MNSIWENDGGGWRLLAPAGFPAEAALHDLVEGSPNVLPVSGGANLAIVGREVLPGGNYADLIAVEPSGRLVVIEIKLARNAEARRAVIAQILTYAAYLRGTDVASLEQTLLASHLLKRGFETLAHAVLANDQQGSFDVRNFTAGLQDSLDSGKFRLVLVLDEAPAELVRLVGYLEAVSDGLVIDLITVAAYAIGGSQATVPQRIDPEHQVVTTRLTPPVEPPASGRLVSGTEDFEAKISETSAQDQSILRRMVEWAKELEREGLATLSTFQGTTDRVTLLPRLPTDNVGFVTIWNHHGFYLSLWRSVFVRRAPSSLERVERAVAPAKVGQGTTTRTISDELLAALTLAYREAAAGRVEIDPTSSGNERLSSKVEANGSISGE
jgi:hypothetical protein